MIRKVELDESFVKQPPGRTSPSEVLIHSFRLLYLLEYRAKNKSGTYTSYLIAHTVLAPLTHRLTARSLSVLPPLSVQRGGRSHP